ncbi:hypothetical protein [Pelomicrobium sp.]|jgi:hypothetical protein|uniref:hypothetical protein n=1 Tax=unclassified Pelomicrobium TaxID=2815318 RepID=UPI002FDEC4F4
MKYKVATIWSFIFALLLNLLASAPQLSAAALEQPLETWRLAPDAGSKADPAAPDRFNGNVYDTCLSHLGFHFLGQPVIIGPIATAPLPTARPAMGPSSLIPSLSPKGLYRPPRTFFRA